VNQPLNAILNNSEVAITLLGLKDIPLEELRSILTDIRADDIRAGEAIRRIRLLTKRQEIAMEQLQIDRLLEDTIRLVRGDALRRRVSIQTRSSSDLPVVRGDPIHLQHVLLNLIINGMDAMDNIPESERLLIVRAERDPDNHLLVTIRDTGQGVSPEILPRIFESFFSTKKDGMGVGLSIARSIIEAHGGRIWCENDASRGATFRFVLPPGSVA